MPPKEPDRELQLLRLVRRGDASAMKTVYSTYVRYLAALCARYVCNGEDAKDVLQDSFLKIFSGLESFEYRGEGSLKGWMTKITVNEILKFLRRNNRFEFVEISEQEHDRSDEDPGVDRLPPGMLFDLIRSLPAGYRTIFNLYVIEQKSHKEIAKLLDIKESTSASQLHRAKALLADRIRHYNSQHP